VRVRVLTFEITCCNAQFVVHFPWKNMKNMMDGCADSVALSNACGTLPLSILSAASAAECHTASL
jgi:hypothetical protein